MGSIYVYFPALSPYINSNYFSLNYFIVLVICQLIQLFFSLFINYEQSSAQFDIFKDINKIRLRKVYLIIPLILSVMIICNSLFKEGLPIFFKLFLSDLSSRDLVLERALFFSEEGSFFIKEIGFLICPTLVTIYFLIKKIKYPSKKNTIIFFLSLFIASLLSLSFFHKTPLLILLFSIGICNLLVKRKRLSIKKLLRYTLFLFVLIVAQYYIVLRNQEIDSLLPILNSILNRVFGAYPLDLAVVIHLTQETGFLLGNTIPNFGGFFQHTPINLSKLIHYEIFGVEGNAPAPALGYAYANFGLLGVVFDTFFVCFFLRIVNQFVNQFNNSYMKILIICVFVPKILFVSMTSIYGAVLNPRDYVVYGVVLFFMMLKIKI